MSEIMNKKNFSMKNSIKLIWIISTFGIISVSVISRYIGGVWFFIDLFSHFQLQYLIAITVIFMIGVIFKLADFKIFGLIFVFVISQLIIIYPLKFSKASDEQISKSDLFYINANYFNKEGNTISQYIEDKKMETVAIVELNEDLDSKMQDNYGLPVVRSGFNSKTCAIYSNNPTAQEYHINGDTFTYPICTAKIDAFVIVLIHPYPPFGQLYYENQIKYFEEISSLLNNLEAKNEKFILIGDFNSSIYSPIFREKFKDIFKINNYTWKPYFPLMIPIDHAMSNIDIKVAITDKLTSDHAGLFVDFK